jgi:cell division protein FtsI/penicillin-binding protein 2
MKNGPISEIPVRRYLFIGGALSLAGLFIFVWIIRIQTSEAAKQILANAESYMYTRKTVYPERGNIYDRWGHLLAGNTEVYELGADLSYVSDPQNIAMTVSSLIDKDYQETLDLLLHKENPELRYVVLANEVRPEKIDELKAIMKQLDEQAAKLTSKQKKDQRLPSLEGLIWTPRLQRSYPEHSLGSTIIGFYAYKDRKEPKGYFGIEGKYDYLLAGQPVEVMVPQDPFLIDSAADTSNITPGASLMLTIDREIQGMTEQVIDEAVQDNGAQSGTIIVMDPRNGEILAMASTPRLDPNEYWKYPEIFPANTPFSRGVEATYEPGSVFKVLTMAAAIDSGKFTPDTVFLDTGSINVSGINIYNWDRGAWGPQTMTGCMQHSLNVCLAHVALELGPTTFYSYMQRFGIGHMTGIDLFGEANWPLSVQGDPTWYPVSLATNSFGQGLAATPVQMVTAISAVANNQGKMMAPHVLKAVIENGQQYNNPPQVISTPITAESARTMSEMLAVSLEEESSVALVEGYRVAGKTGTGEIGGPEGYNTSLTNASFVGWGPVDDPRFIVYVWLEKPTSSPWGSVVASPIFSEVVSNLVVMLDLPPDEIRQQLANQ